MSERYTVDPRWFDDDCDGPDGHREGCSMHCHCFDEEVEAYLAAAAGSGGGS